MAHGHPEAAGDRLAPPPRSRTGAPDRPAADRFTDDLFDRRGEWRAPPGRWDRGDPSGRLDREEFWAALHTCLDKLPARLHEVFVLRYRDETAGDEVCRELGLTPSNLRFMLHRARLRMWWCLSQNWLGEKPQGEGIGP